MKVASHWEEFVSQQALSALHSLVQHLSDLQLKDTADDALFAQLLQVHEQALAVTIAKPSSKVGKPECCPILQYFDSLPLSKKWDQDSPLKGFQYKGRCNSSEPERLHFSLLAFAKEQLARRISLRLHSHTSGCQQVHCMKYRSVKHWLKE